MKKTEEQKFQWQLKRPNSKIIKTIDYFNHNDIVGYQKALKFNSTSKKLMKYANMKSLVVMDNVIKKINLHFKAIKIVSKRYHGPNKVYYIPSGFDKRSFDEEKNQIIELQLEIKNKVDKFIEEKQIIEKELEVEPLINKLWNRK